MAVALITGLGLITPVGVGVGPFWESIQAGRSGISPLTRFDPAGFDCRVAGEVGAFPAEAFLGRKDLRRLDRFAQFSVVAARLALADADLDPGAVDPDRAGVFLGSALGGVAFAEEQYPRYAAGGLRAIHPMLALAVFVGAAPSNVAIHLGWRGPATANGDSCAAGAIALGHALNLLRRGLVDVVLAGGVEAPLSPLCFGAFDLIRALSRHNHPACEACRPFDATRNGFVMAEGAAVLVLESEQHARRRGARVYAALAGASLTNDGYHMTVPRPDTRAAQQAITLALADAGMAADEVEAINAHASGTLLNDAAETAAIQTVFGERARRLPVSGTKSMHGHALGASGAIEAAIAALSIHHGFIPPTISLRQPDPECNLDYVPWEGRRRPVRTVLSNSFGFGGINACLALRAVE
ncbi:MAG: beta-ketoacyl-[acyl-carrier-protein] synthase family protein [Armatimonadetes bacterium]|nr:beta-ketoacyl-[acyl-carrier-protein] synthase family protein [Armatimonadota bacterium]